MPISIRPIDMKRRRIQSICTLNYSGVVFVCLVRWHIFVSLSQNSGRHKWCKCHLIPVHGYPHTIQTLCVRFFLYQMRSFIQKVERTHTSLVALSICFATRMKWTNRRELDGWKHVNSSILTRLHHIHDCACLHAVAQVSPCDTRCGNANACITHTWTCTHRMNHSPFAIVQFLPQTNEPTTKTTSNLKADTASLWIDFDFAFLRLSGIWPTTKIIFFAATVDCLYSINCDRVYSIEF